MSELINVILSIKLLRIEFSNFLQVSFENSKSISVFFWIELKIIYLLIRFPITFKAAGGKDWFD